MFYNLLVHMWLVLNFLPTVFCFYQFTIGLAALIKNRSINETATKYNRFAILIAARDEENVIASLIESLYQQNYPKELIDVIVVADNCIDATAEIAAAAGAIVYQRFNKVEIGKGYAIKFTLDKIEEERDVYDAFCIVDADNIVDNEFVSEMNKSLCRGACVAQGYRDIKNPTDNWVSGSHALFFWMENRFYNFARNNLGLSATINGTAIMISDEYIKEFGYNMRTMTEDIELTFQCIMNGKKVDWVPTAKVYDEQPLLMSQSMIQRTRWIGGFFQCFSAYFTIYVKSFIKKPDWIKLDIFMFVMSLPVMIIGAFATILYAALGVLRVLDPATVLFNMVILAVGSLLAFWLIGIITVLLENPKKALKMKSALLLYPIFNLSWLVIYVKCFFNRKIEWEPIVHGRNISINEIEPLKK